jgi:hypothetical protein
VAQFITGACVEMPFKLDSISQIAAPSGATGLWHRYVISQEGTNTIAGTRAGTHYEVATRAGELVERLNERREGKTRPKGKR